VSRHAILLLILCLVALPAGRPAAAQVAFGTSISVEDDQIFIGEPGHELRPGLLRVFRRASNGTWTLGQSLEAPDGTPGDRFGIGSTADGDWLLVAATRADEGAGAVYAFRRSGAEWSPAGRLVAEQRSPGDSLGVSLALQGEWAMVGTVTQGSGRGAVHVFRREGEEWRQHSRVAPGDLAAGDNFGGAIALDGDVAFVGAPSKAAGAGAVYAFRYDAAANLWRSAGRVGGEIQQQQAGLGSVVLASAGRLLVSAPGLLGVGAVLQFDVPESGEAFELSGALLPFDATGAGFGTSLAMTGQELWVGVGATADGEGRAYRYRWDEEAEEWIGGAKAVASGLEEGDAFGLVVASSSDVAVVSALGQDLGAGAAFVFERAGEGWREAARLVSEVTGPSPIVGEEVSCSDEGAAGLFDCSQVDMLSFLPLAHMEAGRGVQMNDIWGWTDPETGRDIVIAGMTDQAVFVDVSDPLRPVYLGRLPMPEGANGSSWRDMKVYADHVFVVSDGAGPHGMQVFDLTRLRGLDGGDPVTLREDVRYDGIASAHNIVINEETGFAYVVGAGDGGETCGGGLHMVDIRDPRAPTFVGCFADPSTGRSSTGYTHDAQCVVYRGPDAQYEGREICFGSNETALLIADVTDKDNPVTIASATYPNVAYSHQGWLSEDQRHFFMNDELDETGGLVSNTRTLVWDIAELGDPILAREYFADNGASDHNLYVVGSTLYQSNYVSGLRVLDISDPENPVQVGFFDTVPYGADAPGFSGSWSNYPFFDSGVVVVTSEQEGIFVVRYRRPSVSQ
jgi:choice-of-anchor B domain-containing protein